MERQYPIVRNEDPDRPVNPHPNLWLLFVLLVLHPLAANAQPPAEPAAAEAALTPAMAQSTAETKTTDDFPTTAIQQVHHPQALEWLKKIEEKHHRQTRIRPDQSHEEYSSERILGRRDWRRSLGFNGIFRTIE